MIDNNSSVQRTQGGMLRTCPRLLGQRWLRHLSEKNASHGRIIIDSQKMSYKHITLSTNVNHINTVNTQLTCYSKYLDEDFVGRTALWVLQAGTHMLYVQIRCLPYYI